VHFTKYGEFQDHTHKFNSITPSILHVNHESRKEGLKLYQLSKTNEFAKNQFYLCPEIDTVNPILPSFAQLRPFLEQDDCGLLARVQRTTIPEAYFLLYEGALVKYWYFSQIREVTFIAIQDCEWDSGRHGQGRECKCQVKSFAEFWQLTAEGKKTVIQDMRLIDRERLERKLRLQWKTFGEKAYPVIWGVVICGASEDWTGPSQRSGDVGDVSLLESDGESGSEDDP
jgi:hypothetical protein